MFFLLTTLPEAVGTQKALVGIGKELVGRQKPLVGTQKPSVGTRKGLVGMHTFQVETLAGNNLSKTNLVFYEFDNSERKKRKKTLVVNILYISAINSF